MTRQEFDDMYILLSYADVYGACREINGMEPVNGIGPDERYWALDRFLDYIGFPKEDDVAYCRSIVPSAKGWAWKFEDTFIGYFEPCTKDTFDAYLEDYGLRFREGCTGKEELDDGEFFCEKVVDSEGDMDIRRYWARMADDTLTTEPEGTLCHWLWIDGYVWDEWDDRFSDMEAFMDPQELEKQIDKTTKED